MEGDLREGDEVMPHPVIHQWGDLIRVSDVVGLVAGAGLATYGSWRDQVHEMSAVASDMAPIIGIAWIIIQAVVLILRFVLYFIKWWRRK